MKKDNFGFYILKKFPLQLLFNTFLLFISSLLEAASIFSLVVIVDLFLNSNLQNSSQITTKIISLVEKIGIPATFGWLLAIFVVFNILKIAFQIFAQNSILKTKYAVLYDVMLGTFKDFFNARWYFFSSGKQGTFINTFLREISALGDAFAYMARYFSGILQILLYLIVPLFISWQVTLISLAAALVFSIPFFFLSKISYRLGKVNIATTNQIGAVIQENLASAKIVLGFASQAKSIKMLSKAFDAHRRVTVKLQTLSYSLPLLFYPFGLVILIIGIFGAKRFSLALSETVVLFYSLMRVIPLVGSLTEIRAYMHNFAPSYEQVTDLRQRAVELSQPLGVRKFSGFNKEILISGLTFAYPNHTPVLFGVNVRIPKGKMIAFVGESGSGKSTLIDVLMGFNEPISGKITIDNISLSEFDINSYRQRIGYVPQDSILFNMSIKDNLFWACETAREEEIIGACQLANAQEFIAKFTDGYNTIVGDRGVRLSGGQIQRIALARAILRKPELLILDEATSALDTSSERLIQQAIENIAKETTVIVVAHRLSTIVNADYIYVLKNGKIEGEGTYFELMQTDSNFSRMVKLQALGLSKE